MKDANLITKICKTCNEEKLLTDFRKWRNKCKRCEYISHVEYIRTKEGLIVKKYGDQKENSRRRGDRSPEYNFCQLREWAFDQPLFHKLFDEWVASGYQKMLVPSFDRADDYQGYSLDRLQIMTWDENKKKGEIDKVNGVNNKDSTAVVQLTMDGIIVKEYYSQMQASRDTGISQGNIGMCCRGERRSASGFKWEYA